MPDMTPEAVPQQAAPVAPPAQEVAAPEPAKAIQTGQSPDETAAPKKETAAERRERTYTERQWAERTNSYESRLTESQKQIEELRAQVEAAKGVATAPQRDLVDEMLEQLGDDPSAAAIKEIRKQMEELRAHNEQLRQVTTKSRQEYWQDHYSRVFDEVKREFPHMDFDAYIAEFGKLSPQELAKTDAYEFAKAVNEREERAYSRRVDARKDEILKQWGFAEGAAPARVEQQAEARAEAEVGGPKRDVAGKFAPRPGKSPTQPSKKDDGPDYLKYHSPEGAKALAARILRQNSGSQAN